MENFGNIEGDHKKRVETPSILRSLKKWGGRLILTGGALATGTAILNSEKTDNVSSQAIIEGSHIKLKTANDLSIYFENKKDNPAAMVFAATRLIEETTKDGIDSVGTMEMYDKHPISREIKTLRDYIRPELQNSSDYNNITEKITNPKVNEIKVSDLFEIIKKAEKITRLKVDKEINPKTHKTDSNDTKEFSMPEGDNRNLI